MAKKKTAAAKKTDLATKNRKSEAAKGRKSDRKNGKPNGAKKTKKVSTRTKSVGLTKEEKEIVLPMGQKIRVLKMQLAEVQIKIMNLESRRMEIAEELVASDKRLHAEAKGVAASHGIDTEDPSKGRWTLDTDGGVFTRTE